jgi:hypothetical protein
LTTERSKKVKSGNRRGAETQRKRGEKPKTIRTAKAPRAPWKITKQLQPQGREGAKGRKGKPDSNKKFFAAFLCAFAPLRLLLFSAPLQLSLLFCSSWRPWRLGGPLLLRRKVLECRRHPAYDGTFIPRCTAGRVPIASNQRLTLG